MSQEKNIGKPILSPNTFWDTKLDALDFDKYSKFTILRVFERGLDNEIQEIIRYYGKKEIIKTLTSSDQLMSRAFNLSKKLFHLSNSDYKCFERKQQAMPYSRSERS
jgi:hypothetical protein